MTNLKIVYSLKEYLAQHPERVTAAQSATLDRSKPLGGLKGNCGLFGSPQWWRSVEDGKIRRAEYRGVIRSIYLAGMDSGEQPNSFEIEDNAGTRFSWTIVANRAADMSLFEVGRWVEVITIFDELKRPNADGSPRYHEEPLQISISGESA